MLIILYGLIGSLVPGLGTPDSLYQLANGTLTTITFLFVPLSVGIAILRYRLWDIDLIIRRTIVYSTSTLILVLIYVGLVFIFGALLRNVPLGRRENPLVIVASTLVVAALFQPLRHGIQPVIDRRFYRRKYNATPAPGGVQCHIAQRIGLEPVEGAPAQQVVQQTMQPARVSLWSRKSDNERKSGTQE